MFCLFGGRDLGIGIAGSKVNRTHTTCCKSSNNIAWLINLVTDLPEHMAELSLVDADVVFLILKNNFTVLSLHLAKDDNIERLAEMCGVGNKTKRKDLINNWSTFKTFNHIDLVIKALPNKFNCFM